MSPGVPFLRRSQPAKGCMSGSSSIQKTTLCPLVEPSFQEASIKSKVFRCSPEVMRAKAAVKRVPTRPPRRCW